MNTYKPTTIEIKTLTWNQLIAKAKSTIVELKTRDWNDFFTRGLTDGEAKIDRITALLKQNPLIGITAEGFVAITLQKNVTLQDIATLDYAWVANSWIATHTGTNKVVNTIDLTPVHKDIATPVINAITSFYTAISTGIEGIMPINVKHDIFTSTVRVNLLHVDGNTIEIPSEAEAAFQAINLTPAQTNTNAIEGVDSRDLTYTGQIIFKGNKFQVDWDQITTVPEASPLN